jgi:hypothetical protein
VTTDLFLSLGRRQHSDPVAELQHQVGRRHQVGVVSSNVQQMYRITGWQRQTGERDANHGSLPNEDPDVVKVGAVAGKAARLQPAELRGCLCDRIFALRDDQHCVADGHHGIGCRNEITPALAHHRHLHVAQYSGRQIVELPAGKAFADRDLPHVETLRFRRKFRLCDARHEVDAEDRSNDAEGVCDGIADRRLLVLHHIERAWRVAVLVIDPA